MVVTAGRTAGPVGQICGSCSYKASQCRKGHGMYTSDWPLKHLSFWTTWFWAWESKRGNSLLSWYVTWAAATTGVNDGAHTLYCCSVVVAVPRCRAAHWLTHGLGEPMKFEESFEWCAPLWIMWRAALIIDLGQCCHTAKHAACINSQENWHWERIACIVYATYYKCC